METFQDRFHAGQLLAKKLKHYRGAEGLLVLGLPRGGVPVALEVAKALEAPLDVFLVRKLGLPGHRELAMGAVATGSVRVLNHEVIDASHVSPEVIDRVTEIEQRELLRQERLFRQNRPPVQVVGRVVILIDDGLATGSTMRTALQALRLQNPDRLIVAVPVGAADTCATIEHEADEVVCAITPDDFMAVGAWYEDFSPTSEQVVSNLLEEAAGRTLHDKVPRQGYHDPQVVRAWGD